MRPFLVTEQQAGKLPRWALLALCVLYVLPGFIGRDPWRSDDATGFGVSLSMALGEPLDWLVPGVAGEPMTSSGPLPFWLGAAVIRLLPFASAHTGARLAAAATLLFALWALWYAIYSLARQPGLLFTDPFGASATRVDFARALADSALLILFATFGVIAPLHETTPEITQVAIVALYLFGIARAIERPRSGGALAGLAIGGTVLAGGWLVAGSLAAATLVLPGASRGFRLTARTWLPICGVVAVAVAATWPLALANTPGMAQAHLARWVTWNQAQFGLIDGAAAQHYLRTIPWYFWPAWPIAAWALYRWRGRLSEPALALPLTVLAALLAAMAVGTDNDDLLMPLAALPMAMLAAAGLPTLRRAAVSLIDWFAVITFTLIGLFVWAYWIAMLTGVPPRMAASAARIAPGYQPDAWLVLDFVLGVGATLAWLLLVRWRVSRHPPVIWRAVVLSGGGLVLAWFLLMTLWLPAFNQRNTYRVVAQQIAAEVGSDHRCVVTRRLGMGHRANLLYFAGLRFGGEADDCEWLLVQDDGPIAHVHDITEPGWTGIWQGARPRDRDERLRLYRKAD